MSYPSSTELTSLTESGGCLDFLHNEPEIYTIADGKAISEPNRLK
ncbi:MAG: hypothetical protein WBF90_10690 [Rivularia sp. (in: cyanobacteria)]